MIAAAYRIKRLSDSKFDVSTRTLVSRTSRVRCVTRVAYHTRDDPPCLTAKIRILNPACTFYFREMFATGFRRTRIIKNVKLATNMSVKLSTYSFWTSWKVLCDKISVQATRSCKFWKFIQYQWRWVCSFEIVFDRNDFNQTLFSIFLVAVVFLSSVHGTRFISLTTTFIIPFRYRNYNVSKITKDRRDMAIELAGHYPFGVPFSRF